MNLKKIEANNLPYTALLYCKPGVGKSTAIGLIAERSEGNTRTGGIRCRILAVVG